MQNGPFEVLPDAAGHETFDLALFARAGEDGPSVAASLSGMMLEGPLGRLYRFDDAIRMDPRVNVGLPTLRNSSLETSFITRLVRMSSVETVAQLYQKEPALLRRAVEFEEAA